MVAAAIIANLPGVLIDIVTHLSTFSSFFSLDFFIPLVFSSQRSVSMTIDADKREKPYVFHSYCPI